MKASNPLVKNYYVGDPESPEVRGQDEDGYVHCLVWLMIYAKGDFFAGPDEYACGINGSVIGNVKTIEEGRKKLFDFTIKQLQQKKAEALDLIQRCDEALNALGDDPANLERFHGEYQRRND